MIRAGVVGAAGYVGSELLRWLLLHPGVEVALATSGSRAGQPVGHAIPALAGLTDLALTRFDGAALSALDVVFLATPHGAAKELVPALRGARRVIDLSADHRHVAGWVYGQPELAAEAIRGADRVAAPGCFATALELALGPLARAGVLTGAVSVAAATGSTGSGATASAATHHPERFANLKAYKVLSHQHVPEVLAFLGALGQAPPIRFVPMSAPLDRGIFATVFAPVGDADASAILRDAYADHRLVRFRAGSPELRLVRGTAFADLSVHQDGDTAVVLVAIDNLGKGAASQAVQCLNLQLGLPSETALLLPAATP